MKQAADEILYLNNRISVLKKELETRRVRPSGGVLARAASSRLPASWRWAHRKPGALLTGRF